MTPLDWSLVVLYCVVVLALGLWAQRREAGKDTESYFLSRRDLPWWIAGASMAASAFSIDTPIYVAKLTQGGGVAANWEWWYFGVSGILGATVMARYWRRAGIVTDLELITLRYTGRAAHVLRGFRAVFFGLIFNPLGMAAVIAAMIKVLREVDPDLADANGWPQGDGLWLIPAVILVAVTYSVLSGFMGVVLTDLAQFAVSIAGATIMAIYAVSHERVGGLGALAERTAAMGKTDFLPDLLTWDKATVGFAVFLGVSWWTYVNADGGGKYIQRLASCRDETEAERATWFSTITFVGVRSWPWILVALAALLIFPAGEADAESAYPRLMMMLPTGLRGFVFASLIAAFMSTIDTQLNWGASYLVNDLIKPYLLKDRSERFYVWVARACAIPTLLVVLLFLWELSKPAVEGSTRPALEVTKILRSVILVSSGLGAVYLLRWFWWRLTAWGEVAAMATAPVAATLCGRYEAAYALAHEGQASQTFFALKILIVTGATLGAAATVSLLAPRKDSSHLAAFVERVKPAGLWGPYQGERTGERVGRWLALRLVAGNMILFGFTFFVGGLLLAKGAGVVLGNLILLVAGIALDRWARGRLPSSQLGGAEDEATGGGARDDVAGAGSEGEAETKGPD